MKFNRRTDKLYYADPWLSRCASHVIKTDGDWVELDATVAYPEGGGQDSDRGLLTLGDGTTLRFVHAKKMYSHAVHLPGFPDIRVDGIVLHQIHADDRHRLPLLTPGTAVSVSIDIARRAALSLSHTASHLLYLAIGIYRPDAASNTLGCHIKTDSARFDVRTESRFTAEELVQIESTANRLVRDDLPIAVTAHPDIPDARSWHCAEQTIPCGGTHIERTGFVGPLAVRRRSLGKDKERIYCEFPAATYATGRYHH